MKPARVSALAAVVLLAGSAIVIYDQRAGDAPERYQFPFTCNEASLTADMGERDELRQTDTPRSDWYDREHGRYLNGGWGPDARELPPVRVPRDAGCDASTWRRERIVATALHYLNVPGNPRGLQYRHHHIPAWDPPTSTAPDAPDEEGDLDGQAPESWGPGRGLDCSTFASWVYNYGLGIQFGGNVRRQYAGKAGEMGLRIPRRGPFKPGDLLYLHPERSEDRASHVVIFLDDQHVIDSRLNAQDLAGVQVRQREGWYRTAVLGGWRPTERLSGAGRPAN